MRSPGGRAAGKIALVDMDGTVADYGGQAISDLQALASPGEPPISGPIELLEQKPWLKARLDLIKRQPGWWRGLPKLVRGFDIVTALRCLNYEIHVATKGPHNKSRAWAEKVEWCREHLPDASVHIVEEKSLLYGKVLVDDWPAYVESWLEWRPRGLAIVPAYPYNEHLEGRENVFLYRDLETSMPALIDELVRRIRK